MKIVHDVNVAMSCAKMHVHWWDKMQFTYDDAFPLEVQLSLTDRDQDAADIHWRLPRIELADAVTYGVPGPETRVGVASLKIRTKDTRIVSVRLPYRDADGHHDVFILVKLTRIKTFLAEADHVVPLQLECESLSLDRLLGRLLYR